jgi:hypothetical protein
MSVRDRIEATLSVLALFIGVIALLNTIKSSLQLFRA